MINSQKIRYLIVGGINTAIGYGVGVGSYKLLSPILHIVAIGVLSNIIAITVSFLTYKLFVFKTKGNWLPEYFRAWLVYGGMAAVGVALLWAFVDGMRMPIWLAQGLVILLTVVISYLGHARYTFRRKTSAIT